MARRSGSTKTKAKGGLWSGAKDKAKEGGFDDAVPLEAGVYNMQLVSVEIGDFGSERKLMTKWAVIGDDENDETICTYWEGLESEERLVWLQRQMMALGMDLDAISEDNMEDDVIDAYGDALADGLVARVKVIEKDGYTNMRIQKAIEWDEDELYNPDDVLGGKKAPAKKGKGKAAKKEEAKEDELEAELEAMDKVELKAFIKEEKLDIKGARKMTEDELIDAILDAMEE